MQRESFKKIIAAVENSVRLSDVDIEWVEDELYGIGISNWDDRYLRNIGKTGVDNSCGSVVAYVLGFADEVPDKPVGFEVSRGRPDAVDVDVDIEIKRRYEIKNYVDKKYGFTGNIMTFNYFRGKSAIKAAATVYKIPIGETNKAVKNLVDDPDFPVLDAYLKSPSTAEFRRKYPEVYPLAKFLDGRIRGVGMHAGGTIISKMPIEEYVPMQSAPDPNDAGKDRVPVAAVDMNEAASIGFVKYDFLGLTNLTVIKETIEQIERDTGKVIDPYEIPLDDPDVYKMISSGHTQSVFQVEGGPYTQMILKMGGVSNFEELVASNALVRPGAANSSIGETYIRGKETGEVEYIHKDVAYFTRETYSAVLFQEQQMLLCVELAGMSMREANQVRQAIGKKKADKLAVWKPVFIEGASKKIGEARAKEVWDDLEKSAEYAFNKAHSVGYSMISYWTAWFKYYYPAEYLCAVLNNASGTDSKVKIMFTLLEAKRIGVKIRLPHINRSDIKCRVEDGAIRLGLEQIKYISDKVGAKIIDNGPYETYQDFINVAGAKFSGINSRAVDALNKVGAAHFEDNPKTGDERNFFYEYLSIPAFDTGSIDPDIKASFRPLAEYTDSEAFVSYGMVFNMKIGQGWSLIEMVDESGSAAAFADGNTMIEKGKLYIFLIANNRIERYISIDELVNDEGGLFTRWLKAGRLRLEDGEYRCISFKAKKNRMNKPYASVVLTDGDKNLLPAMIFSELFDSAKMICITGSKFRPELSESTNGSIIINKIGK